MLKFFSPYSEVSKNVLTLISGTAVAQLIVLLLAPILSRLYTPEEFGVLGVYMSIVSGVAVFCGGRYELAIMLPEKDEEAASLLGLAFLVNIAVSTLSFVLAFSLAHFYSGQMRLSGPLTFWIYFFPLFVFFIGSYQILSNWANRKKQYRRISYYRVANSLVTTCSNTGLGIMKTGASGLFFGNLAGNIFAIAIFWNSFYTEIRMLLRFVSFKSMMKAAKQYKMFPLVNSVQALSDMLQINGLIYFISYFFNYTVVGSFSYTIRVLQAPMNFAGGAIAQVFYQHASAIKNEKHAITRLVSRTIIKSALIAFPVPVVILLFGPELFGFVFGERWTSAGEYARILAPWFYLDFIRAAVSQIVFITENQSKLLLFSFAGNIILAAAMLYGGLIARDVKQGFLVFSVLQSILTIFILLWLKKISNRNTKEIPAA